MGELQDRIEKSVMAGVAGSIDRAIPGMVDKVVAALFNHPAYPCIVGGQLRLIKAGIAPSEAWEMSRNSLLSFLAMEKIKFGDERYAWDAEMGSTLAEEMEIEHWDAVPS